jgi:4-aminobutyrate aminotransferase-like enzyme/Ser/Thr protein kinase RdoA (MazF antagonist)
VATLVGSAPKFSEVQAALLADEVFGIRGDVSALPSERDQNFRIGADHVLKIANGGESREFLELQHAAMARLRQSAGDLEWPAVVPARYGTEIVEAGSHLVRMLTWIPGTCFAEVKPHSPELLASLGRALAQMDLALAGFDSPAAHRHFHWDLRQAAEARQFLPLLPAERRDLLAPLFDAWERVDWNGLPHSAIHNDANDYNVLARDGRVVSVLDFGDMVWSATVCNLAVALAYAMLDQEDPIAAAAAVTAAYRGLRPLSEPELDALYPLAATRLAMSVCYCAWQSGEAPQNDYLNISNRPAWALLERLAAMPEGWAVEVLRGAAEAKAGLLARRRRSLGPSLSISYREPLHITRGRGAYLYDSGGRGYLDCVNNVAHVGHSHPRVVRAAADQMARLNTNTRYLDAHLVEYVERLAATLPEPLRVVYLVCSGSEANELALRLARAHTGRDGVLVVDTAYHGNTNALIDISPYKFNGPGGRGKAAHVTVLPIPQQSRDRQGAVHQDRGSSVPLPDGRGSGLAAFFCESALSCAGQVILPAGYLRDMYAQVRAAGGVCVADEVQTGFGRAGSHFWMFETQDVRPDIVTMGKPIGNGHPIGAVVTTPEIAASFANGMEYFNTFGGNPVSCAVGLAVLDVIRDEGLQENARAAGEYLIAGLRDLQARQPLITDVRGLGLFLGFEMPGEAEATALVNRTKDRGVLLSTDGPRHNVIKIKPPLVFSHADADRLLERLDHTLRELH